MRVFVYFNLHRKLWSVKALEGPNKGRVIARERDVHLYDVTPKVSEAGRQRVLREKRKNVHAGLVGQWGEAPAKAYWPLAISYNPYKGPTFYYKAPHLGDFTHAEYVHLQAPEGAPPKVTTYWGAKSAQQVQADRERESREYAEEYK